MKNLDLSILEKIPDCNLRVVLEIEPLAPLSMVSELPGSYYKTLKSPDKKMLCGLFENVLGWHIDLADRKQIFKDLEKLRKKQAKKNPDLNFCDRMKGSTFIPLLMDYFDINLRVIPEPLFYDDLWSRAYRRADAVSHPNGTFNLDYRLISEKMGLKRDEKNAKKIDENSLADFFKNNLDQYPLYYSTPTTREYVQLKGKYMYRITIDKELYTKLKDRIQFDNIGYLGNSEGWVDIKFIEL